jgi:sugar phosphate isomerase/epimerase
VTVFLAASSLRGTDLPTVLAAAAEAGFDGITVGAKAVDAWCAEDHDLTELAALLADHGLRIGDLGFLGGWAGDPGQRAAARTTEDAMYRIHDAVGATTMLLLSSTGTTDDTVAAEALAEVADRAAAHGLPVAVEFMPTTEVPDLPAAVRVVGAAGRESAGICLDTWHHTRAGGGPADPVPAGMLRSLHLSDGPLARAVPDYLEETQHHRRPPGEGEFGVRALVRAYRGVPVTVEVLSDAVAATPPREAAAHLRRAARTVLEER